MYATLNLREFRVPPHPPLATPPLPIGKLPPDSRIRYLGWLGIPYQEPTMKIVTGFVFGSGSALGSHAPFFLNANSLPTPVRVHQPEKAPNVILSTPKEQALGNKQQFSATGWRMPDKAGMAQIVRRQR